MNRREFIKFGTVTLAGVAGVRFPTREVCTLSSMLPSDGYRGLVDVELRSRGQFHVRGAMVPAADDTAELKQRIAEAVSAGGGVVTAGPGKLYFSDMVSFPSGVHFQGKGISTELHFRKTGGTAVKITGDWDVSLSGFQLFDDGGDALYGILIDSGLEGDRNVEVASCRVYGFNQGIRAKDAFYLRLNDVYFNGQKNIGLYLLDNVNNVECKGCTWTSTGSAGQNNYAVRCTGGAAIKFDSCAFEGTIQGGSAAARGAVYVTYGEVVTFENCYFEANQYEDILIESETTNLNITGSYFYKGTNTPKSYAVKVAGGSRSVNISRNRFIAAKATELPVYVLSSTGRWTFEDNVCQWYGPDGKTLKPLYTQADGNFGNTNWGMYGSYLEGAVAVAIDGGNIKRLTVGAGTAVIRGRRMRIGTYWANQTAIKTDDVVTWDKWNGGATSSLYLVAQQDGSLTFTTDLSGLYDWAVVLAKCTVNANKEITAVDTTVQPMPDQKVPALLLPRSFVALPTAAVTYRGKLARVEGDAGVADALYLCIKNAADGYEWLQIS